MRQQKFIFNVYGDKMYKDITKSSLSKLPIFNISYNDNNDMYLICISYRKIKDIYD